MRNRKWKEAPKSKGNLVFATYKRRGHAAFSVATHLCVIEYGDMSLLRSRSIAADFRRWNRRSKSFAFCLIPSG